MLKIYSIIIGENPQYTAKYQPGSKRKVALYANCLLVPVILWFIIGFLIVTQVLEGRALTAVLTACISALVIFLIERAIIMSNGSKPIFWFRIFLGIIVAALGSISFDEVLFKNDIDNQIAEYKQKEIEKGILKVDRRYENRILTQQAIVREKDNKLSDSYKDAKGEADGSSGSHQKQVGKIAMLKMGIANKIENEYNLENQKLDDLIASRESEKKNTISKVDSTFKGNALLMRIRALFELIAADRIMLIVYILFTSFLFCLEFLVVLIKVFSNSSIDEDLEKEREKLLRAKTQKIIERSIDFYNPEQHTPQVQIANNVLRQKVSSIFD
jgi:hypothetical protein